ncbi:uncharacterized protein EAF01_002229 [Botrytis porri]|uniref:uncharacterized protein n=1 Tax=Botrytis porri TaxID=87229 RepID=UPI0019016DB1|nr:uncharacterized protein EAF01_002229 [Botrytis porri]KAF7910720.1 hypothetical protein EAF01_002229 [Botrytis porri]
MTFEKVTMVVAFCALQCILKGDLSSTWAKLCGFPTTTSPFAACTASDHEWIVHDEAGSPSLGRPERGSNCSALINHDAAAKKAQYRPYGAEYKGISALQCPCFPNSLASKPKTPHASQPCLYQLAGAVLCCWVQRGSARDRLASRLSALHLLTTSEQSRAFSSDQENLGLGADDNI